MRGPDPGRFIDPVNLLQQFGVERIHAIAGNRMAVPANYDPLYASRRATRRTGGQSAAIKSANISKIWYIQRPGKAGSGRAAAFQDIVIGRDMPVHGPFETEDPFDVFIPLPAALPPFVVFEQESQPLLQLSRADAAAEA